MTFFNKLKMGWSGADTVATLVESWEPGTLKNEKQYEDSLYDYILENLEGIEVIKQYGRGRMRADLVVNDDVIIELKNNLDATSKCQRLIGQLSDYKEWDGPIIVVLCGKTDPNLLKKVEKFAEDHIEATGIGVTFEEVFRVIVKKPG